MKKKGSATDSGACSRSEQALYLMKDPKCDGAAANATGTFADVHELDVLL